MKTKRKIILSVIQLIISALAIVAFIVVAFSGEDVSKWIPALCVALVLLIDGIAGIKNYNYKK